MSFGGVTAVQVCAIDDRCRAGISLDAGLPGDYTGQTLDLTLAQPFMFMVSESRAHLLPSYLATVENTGYGVIVEGLY